MTNFERELNNSSVAKESVRESETAESEQPPQTYAIPERKGIAEYQ